MGDGAAARLFISYSHADGRDQAAAIVERFQGRFDILVDHNLRPGDQWHERIEEWMRTCSAAIILLTPRSLESAFCQYEIAVLTSRARATRSLRTDWLRLKLLPYTIGVDAAAVAAVDNLKPTRLAQSEMQPWPDDLESIAAQLAELPESKHAEQHARRLMTYFPANAAALDEVAEAEFDDLLVAGMPSDHAVARGLLERARESDPAEEDFLAGVNRALLRLAESLDAGHESQACELSWYTAAARIPYSDAAALDAPSMFGRVVVVPATSQLVARMVIDCAAASRWYRRRDIIDRVVTEVTLEPAGLDPEAIVRRIRDVLAVKLNLRGADFARSMRRSVIEKGLLPMAIVIPPEGSRLDPAVIDGIRRGLPWCTVILLAGSFAELPTWRSEAMVMMVGDAAAASANLHFITEFATRIDDIADSVRKVEQHV